MVQLGHDEVRRIIAWHAIRAAAVLLLGTVAAVYFCSWAWIAVAGTLISCYGAFLMSRRILRVGPDKVDDPSPPSTNPDRSLNWAHIHDRIARSEDAWIYLIGLWFAIGGALLAGAGVYLLDWLMPFQGHHG